MSIFSFMSKILTSCLTHNAQYGLSLNWTQYKAYDLFMIMFIIMQCLHVGFIPDGISFQLDRRPIWLNMLPASPVPTKATDNNPHLFTIRFPTSRVICKHYIGTIGTDYRKPPCHKRLKIHNTDREVNRWADQLMTNWPLTDEGINNIEIYFDCLRSLHTQAVTEAISNYTPNRVLGTPPPNISPLESFLPWPVRTTLAQLRSGHSRLLKSHMARITTGVSDVCPECGVAPHSVEHLVNCSAHPTQVTVQDLNVCQHIRLWGWVLCFD